ncbi:MAG: hypothetical protein ACI3WU_04640 [Phascolarctobacterium sp.]
MLQRMVGICAPWWRLCCSKRGVLLVDYVLSLAVGAILAAILCTGLGRTAISWQRLLGRLELAQAGRYMQGVLERQLAYNATAIKIRADGSLELDTIDGNKKLLIYHSKGGLYVQTTTGNGTGTNPLFIAGVEVKAWEAERISDQRLRIKFSLQGERCEGSFSQLLTCCNGEVSHETL